MLPNAQPRPPRGEYRAKRKTLKRDRRTHEDREKAKVRVRDKKCRWPHCRHKDAPLEVAHLVPKGKGGDPAGLRTRADLMIRLCIWHHQADPQEGHPEGSLERHNLKIVPLTSAGTNGPVKFLRERVRVTPMRLEVRWIEVAREQRPGVLAK